MANTYKISDGGDTILITTVESATEFIDTYVPKSLIVYEVQYYMDGNGVKTVKKIRFIPVGSYFFGDLRDGVGLTNLQDGDGNPFADIDALIAYFTSISFFLKAAAGGGSLVISDLTDQVSSINQSILDQGNINDSFDQDIFQLENSIANIGGGGSGDALTTNPLSQFAATTSTQLRGVISDETGTGALVFAGSPVFSGPPTTPASGSSVAMLQLSSGAVPGSAINNGMFYDGSTIGYYSNAGTPRFLATLDNAQTLSNKTLASNTIAVTQAQGNSGVLIATTSFVQRALDAIQNADYIINTDGTNITAIPRASSGLTTYTGTDAYTVIQAAITAVSNEGHIYISSGTYTLTNELTITGLGTGFFPYRSLVITGAGFSTKLIQNTSAKNGILIKNRAGVNISNMSITCGSSAKSALRLDAGGTSEISVYQSVFYYLYLSASSSTSPALYAENFQYSHFGAINAININNDAVVLSNNSSSGVNYGNSSFAQLYMVASESSTFANLRVTTGAGGSHGALDHCTFENTELGDIGDYGIYMTFALNFKFNGIDMENFDHCIAIGQGGGSSQGCTFDNAFLIANATSKTAITVGSGSGSNRFINCKILGDSTTIPVADSLTSGGNAPNVYDLWLGSGVLASNISITWASQTILITRSTAGTTQFLPGAVLPASTTTSGMLQLTVGVAETGTVVNNSMAYDGSAIYYYSNAGTQRILVTRDSSETLNNKTIGSGGVISSSVTATTQAAGDSSTKVATTAFVAANALATSTGRVGQTTLVAGTKAISITGVTTSSFAFVTLVSPSGASLSIQYKAVCTAGTLTITADVAAGTINTSDVSILNYLVIN